MKSARFRFYAELNDCLPRHRRQRDFSVTFEGRPPVSNVLAALGVPDSRIDLILVNGVSVSLDYRLKGSDRVSVYPVFESFDIKTATRIREIPLRHTKFLADRGIPAIVNQLRLLDLDVRCDSDLSDKELIEISNREMRIILSRRKQLLKADNIARAVLVGNGTVDEEVQKISDYLQLSDHGKGSEV